MPYLFARVYINDTVPILKAYLVICWVMASIWPLIRFKITIRFSKQGRYPISNLLDIQPRVNKGGFHMLGVCILAQCLKSQRYPPLGGEFSRWLPTETPWWWSLRNRKGRRRGRKRGSLWMNEDFNRLMWGPSVRYLWDIFCDSVRKDLCWRGQEYMATCSARWKKKEKKSGVSWPVHPLLNGFYSHPKAFLWCLF